ncbi:MAG: hypothetical protein GX847_00710 [Clostridiales bacterium]|nr:hypothetical protein [Clostridiales bacterium]
MQSGVIKPSFISLAARSYLFKLRAYSGYLFGLIMAQLLGLALSGANTSNISTTNHNIIINLYGTQLIPFFTAVWIFVIAVIFASRASKDSAFTFPGSRLTDSVSDLAYLLTCCIFGGVTTALSGAALRFIVFILYPGSILHQGFYPVFIEQATIASGTFLYLLLLSSVSYLCGTLIRRSKAFGVLVLALLLFIVASLLNTVNISPFWRAVRSFLFEESSLARFGLISAAISIVFYAVSVIAANFMEVKK